MKELTFVIPAYNAQVYLEKCVSSMAAPEIMNRLEIIIVNDGSTDTTAQIGKSLQDRYPGTVRLISQENRGHGGALNTGCAAATGKYLKVIDADDWVETNSLPAFLDALAECDSDVVLTHHYTIDISSGETKRWMSFPGMFGKPYTLEEIMVDWKNFDRSLTFHGITYRTAFYHQYGIRLSEHVFYEDHEYATFPCCYAQAVTPFDLFVYDYRIGDANQSVSHANQLKRIGHTQTVLSRMTQAARNLSCGPGGKAYAAMKIQGLFLSYLTTALLVEPDRKKGRALAKERMAALWENLPEAAAAVRKKYWAFLLMNRLHITKRCWERILHSGAYNRLRHNHEF